MPRWRRPRPLKFDLSALFKPPPPHYWWALALHILLGALVFVGLLAWRPPAGCDIAAAIADTCNDGARIVHRLYLVIACAVALPPAIYVRRWMTRRRPPKVKTTTS